MALFRKKGLELPQRPQHFLLRRRDIATKGCATLGATVRIRRRQGKHPPKRVDQKAIALDASYCPVLEERYSPGAITRTPSILCL